jgi:hypothetical protein
VLATEVALRAQEGGFCFCRRGCFGASEVLSSAFFQQFLPSGSALDLWRLDLRHVIPLVKSDRLVKDVDSSLLDPWTADVEDPVERVCDLF